MKIAEAFYREGQKKAAIEAYRDALALNVYLPEAHLGIAKAFEKEKYFMERKGSIGPGKTIPGSYRYYHVARWKKNYFNCYRC